MYYYILLLLENKLRARGNFEPGIVLQSEFEPMPFQEPLEVTRTKAAGGGCLDTFLFSYYLTFMVVFFFPASLIIQFIYKMSPYIKFYFSSSLFSAELQFEGKIHHVCFFACNLWVSHQEFLHFWGWHVNLHENPCNSLCLNGSLPQAQRPQALLVEVILQESQQGQGLPGLLYLMSCTLKIVHAFSDVVTSCRISQSKVSFLSALTFHSDYFSNISALSFVP